MSDRRIAVVADRLGWHEWDEASQECDCEWTYARMDDRDPLTQHDHHVAIAILSALDADARRRPFIGIVPPVRALHERDTPGVYPGLDEFHPSTTHRPEAM